MKTEHHDRCDVRIAPLFPELKPLLEEAFDAAEVGDEFVITRTRFSWANPRTTMTKAIKRMGLKPWPKLFPNRRASPGTELCNDYPGHVAAA